MICIACGNPVVPGPKTLYDVCVKRGGQVEVIASAVPITDVQALRREHPDTGVAVHMLAEGCQVYVTKESSDGR